MENWFEKLITEAQYSFFQLKICYTNAFLINGKKTLINFFMTDRNNDGK